MSYYNDQFYRDQINASRNSASKYFEILKELLTVDSIIDIGCGRGPWLTEAQRSILKPGGKLIGIDGTWNDQRSMINQDIKFQAKDLNSPLEITKLGVFELCMCIEVAEHLIPSRSESLIKELCELSDIVMFSAAYSSQGGTHHINERKHSYWAEFFAKNDFLVFDLFREKLWCDKKVQIWHQQNIFIYVKNGSPFQKKLINQGYSPILNLEWMNAVHPNLYRDRINLIGNLKYQLMRMLPQKLVVWISNILKS